MEHEPSLREALSYDGDLELRFQSGRVAGIPVHSQKLKLASLVLRDLIIAVLDDLIASSAAKRRRTAEGGSSVPEQQELPNLKVSHSQSRHYFLYRVTQTWHGPICMVCRQVANAQCPCAPRLMAPMRTGWRC